MANAKGKTEGGSGGKRGHSNMTHWSKTEEIKDETRSQRRQEDKTASESGVLEHGDDSTGKDKS